MQGSGQVTGKPTMKDVADVAGVSKATVSLVLNRKRGISDATRERVIDAAAELGYDTFGRRANGLQATISILIEHLPTAPSSDPFNRYVLASIEAGARQAGCRTVIEFATDEEGPAAGHWAGNWAAGVLVLGGGDLQAEWIESAIEARLPVVIIDHVVPGVQAPVVVPDNFSGAHAMTRYLLDAGHTRIGFLRGPSKYWTLEERMGGYLLAMQQSMHKIDPDLIPARVSHGPEKGFGETLALLDLPEPPTAIFAVSDQAAVGAYRALASRGLTVGQDISVAGFDDIEVAKMLTPPLTTVRNSGTELGRVAFKRLLGMIRGDTPESDAAIKWTIPMRIIERQSVRKL